MQFLNVRFWHKADTDPSDRTIALLSKKRLPLWVGKLSVIQRITFLKINTLCVNAYKALQNPRDTFINALYKHTVLRCEEKNES